MEGDVFTRTHSSSIKMDESHGDLNNFKSQVKVSQYDAVEPKVEPIEEFVYCGEYVDEIPDTLSDSRIPLAEGITGSNSLNLKEVKLELKDCLQDLVAPQSTIRLVSSIKTEPDEYILDHSLDTGPAYDGNTAGCNTDTKIIQHQWNHVSPNKRNKRLLTSQSNLKPEPVTTPPPRNKRKKQVSYEEKITSSSESDNDDSYNPKRRFEVSRSQTKKKARKSVEYSGNAVHHEKSKNKKILVANPEKEVDCQLWSCCDKQFEHFRTYQRHRGQQHNIEEFKCSICTEKSFTSVPELEKHYVDSHGDSFHCLDCRQIFGVKSSYFEHKATCNESKVVCSGVLDSIKDFVVTRKQVKVKENSTFRLSCCNSIFGNFENFMVHKFSDHKIDSLTCGLCLCVNESETQLRSHYQMLHFPKLWEKLELETCDGMEEGTAATTSSNIPKDSDTDEESTEMDGMDDVMGHIDVIGKLKCSALRDGILCQCRVCSKLVDGSQLLVGEAVSKSNRIEKIFNCELCNAGFLVKTRLTKHLKTHEEIKEFSCGICRSGFTTKSSLEFHNRLRHSNALKQTCHICGKVLACKSSLNKHISYVHLNMNKSKEKCEHCGSILSKQALKKHIRSFHMPKQEYICAHCSKIFNDKDKLRNHIQGLHLPNEKYRCEKCDRNFKTEQILKRHHIKVHTDRHFSCEVCGKAFKAKAQLDMHIVCHSDDKPFICTTCGKGFKRYINLRQHEYTHSESRPHTCHICGETFRMRTHVKQHMAVHGLIQNYKCFICNKGFSRKTELKSHLSSHEV